jgi:hypothetical protein
MSYLLKPPLVHLHSVSISDWAKTNTFNGQTYSLTEWVPILCAVSWGSSNTRLYKDINNRYEVWTTSGTNWQLNTDLMGATDVITAVVAFFKVGGQSGMVRFGGI